MFDHVRHQVTIFVMIDLIIWFIKINLCLSRRGSRKFSREGEGEGEGGGVDFQKKCENFFDLFLGRPNWFSELSQTIKIII